MLWKEVDELDDLDESFFLEPERDGPIDPLDLQQAVLSAPTQSVVGTQGALDEEAEEELWENMPDLSQFIPPDKLG
jgi:hypothetical protein